MTFVRSLNASWEPNWEMGADYEGNQEELITCLITCWGFAVVLGIIV